ncbi:MAG: hypothetical protein HY304_01360 [candidate division Zixibacteria bacterium]|nr:hypothetical protein [candidate division Zixibacteria bacterium]
MRLVLSERFRRSYDDAPPEVRRAIERRLALLAENLRYPSLRAKKYDESRGIWQARVNRDWRFYFQIENDAYHLIDVIPHPK